MSNCPKTPSPKGRVGEGFNNTTMKRFILITITALAAFPLFADIGVRLGTVSGMQGDIIEASLFVDGTLTGQNVYSYQFQISYNQSRVELLDVTNGSLLNSASNSVWKIQEESTYYVSITNAFGNALTGTGELIKLKFRMLSSGNTDLIFRGNATNNYFNEGQPAMTFTNGRITVTALPTISVNIPSNTSPMAIGATANLSASGGTTPYTWEVTDNAIATVNASGQLTAKGIGTVRVRATDSKGYNGLSANIEVRGYRLLINDTTFYQNQYVEIPVRFQNLANKPVFSGEFSVEYNSSVLNFDKLIVEDQMIGSAGNVFDSHISAPSSSTQNLRISFAGVAGMTTSGVLAKVRFKITNATSGSTNLSFTSVQFNNDEQAIIRNGVFRITALPALTITPGNATFEHFAGETRQLSVSGGTAPYTWISSKPLIASIDENGTVSILAGGEATIRVSDVWGAYKTVTFKTFDTKIEVPDTLGLVEKRTFRLPINMTMPVSAARKFTAIQGKIVCNAQQINNISIETDNSLTANFATAQHNTDGACTFALSGTQAITQAGTLFYAVIEFNENIRQGDKFNISLVDMILNEGSPNTVIKNGMLTVEVRQSIIAEQEEEGDQTGGTFSVELGMSTTMTFSGTMKVSLPAGFTLDIENTLLNPNLKDLISLSITESGNNSWLFTFALGTSESLTVKSAKQSAADLEPYSNIVNIAYRIEPGITDGVYPVTIKDVLLTFDDESEVNESDFTIRITVKTTGISVNKSGNVKAGLHGGMLVIDTECSERIELYSVTGSLLNHFEKSPGRIEKKISYPTGQMLIVRGKDWAVKVVE